MNKKSIQGVLAGAALLVIGWTARSLVGFNPGESASVPLKTQTVESAVVTLAAVNPVSEYVGHVEPIEETDILPQVEGYLKKVCFTEGASVKAGDLLFEIDAEQYEATRNLRYSEIRNAESQVIVASAEVDRAERYHRRLTAADDRGITATERDTAETTLASAKAKLAAATAAVEQAKASAAVADFNLKHTRVYAPISGRIGKAFHHVGDYVSSSKSPLAHIVRLDPIRVAFTVPDRECDRWRSDTGSRRLRLKFPGGDFYSEEGRIEFGDNRLDRETGTLLMYLSCANGDGRLVPNAFVRVVADEREPKKVKVVPARAVDLRVEGVTVWKLAADDVATPVKVKTGLTDAGITVVEEGLEVGDRVVSSGEFKLVPGAKVKVAK